ncbi:DsbA family protein [Nonomuraea typhae]|uniref:DsbA family protein n=1 Tax=Nonomuraea typhae TaxID=2603600 RepID=A0ABW7ZCP0_9ACTN
MPDLTVHIWFDFVCPWCHLGKRRWEAALTALAAELGLAYRLDQARPVNSFDAHRLLHAAAGRGLGDQVRERLLLAYTGEGADLADHTALAALAQEAGFPAGAARELLRGDAYGDAVRADEDEAHRRGVRGVPSFAIADRPVVAGAQSPDLLLEELRLAWRGVAG